ADDLVLDQGSGERPGRREVRRQPCVAAAVRRRGCRDPLPAARGAHAAHHRYASGGRGRAGAEPGGGDDGGGGGAAGGGGGGGAAAPALGSGPTGAGAAASVPVPGRAGSRGDVAPGS